MTKTTENRQHNFAGLFAAISKHSFITLGLVAVFTYIAIAVLNYRFPSANIQGVSMLPNFQANKTYVTERVFSSPERFDVVVMRPADFDNAAKTIIANSLGDVELYIKRVVGVPGDEIVFNRYNGRILRINEDPVVYSRNQNIPTFVLSDKSAPDTQIPVIGMNTVFDGVGVDVYEADYDFKSVKAAHEKFLSKIKLPYLSEDKHEKNGETITLTVPDAHIFIMSDNRFEGVDSRHFGSVPISAMESVLRREVDND